MFVRACFKIFHVFPQIAGVTACPSSTLVMSKSDVCKNGVAMEQGTALELSPPNVTGGIQLQVGKDLLKRE